LSLRKKHRCIYVAALGVIDPVVHRNSFLLSGTFGAVKNVFLEREIYMFERPYLFSARDVVHGYISDSFSLSDLPKANNYWMVSLRSVETEAYPILSEEYLSLAFRPPSSFVDRDHSLVRFVKDGGEMRGDLFSFQRVHRDDSEISCVMYSGVKYEMKLTTDPVVDYMLWVLRFEKWDLGPSSAFFHGLKTFLHASLELDLPVQWTSLSWKDYLQECRESIGRHRPRDFFWNSYEDVDQGDLRGRDSCDDESIDELEDDHTPDESVKSVEVGLDEWSFRSSKEREEYFGPLPNSSLVGPELIKSDGDVVESLGSPAQVENYYNENELFEDDG